MRMHEFISSHREELVSRTLLALKKDYPDRTADELLDDLPPFIDAVLRTLRGDIESSGAGPSTAFGVQFAPAHGRLRKEQGFDLSRIVHDYGLLCDATNTLASEIGERFTTEEHLLLNRCIDEATAQAIEGFAAALHEDQSQTLGAIGHEIRNAAWSASMAFDLISSGKVGVNGRTGDVLRRSLERIEQLSLHALDAARMTAASTAQREWLDGREFLQQLVDATVGERGIQVHLEVEPALEFEVDPRLLTSAISNLLQNAVKFTHDAGTVTLRASTRDAAVCIEVEDRCGGLSREAQEHMFDPTQRRARGPRSSGFGLAIARQAVEAQGGTLSVDDVPSVGCVFRILFPRSTRLDPN